MTNETERRLFANMRHVKKYPADLRDALPEAKEDILESPATKHSAKEQNFEKGNRK